MEKMEVKDESSYLTSLIAKLYENTAGSFQSPSSSGSTSGDESSSDDGFIKLEKGLDTGDDSANKPESKKRKVIDNEEEFFKNSSANIIAESTEKTLKQMNIDPNSKEGKMQRRKIRNRMSAQIHRDRKKAYIDYLEDKVKKRDEVISILQAMLKKSHREIDELRGNLLHIKEEKTSPMDMPLPMPSPADSSTSTESVFQHHDDSSSGSQSSTSPEIDHYFSDFDIDGNIDSKVFCPDDSTWDSQQYQDLVDLDFDQPFGEDDIMKLPIQGSVVGGGGSLSMFSIVMMMSFSFFTGIFSMSGMTGGTSALSQIGTGVSESPFLQPWKLNGNDGQRIIPEGTYSYGLLPNTKVMDETVEDNSAKPVSHGRVLLSLPTNDDDDDDGVSESSGQNTLDYTSHAQRFPSDSSSAKDKNFDYAIKPTNSRLPSTFSRPSTSLSSLWRRQNYEFIGNIYPRPEAKIARDDLNSTSPDLSKQNRKYLRFRAQKGAENGTSSRFGSVPRKNTDSEIDSSHSSDKSVTLYSELKKSREYISSEGVSDSPFASKVLLSEGRVLLNPLLADLRNAHSSKHDSSQRSPDYDTDRAIIPSVPNMFSSPTSGDKSDGDDSGGSKLLTMMIPASSIQWGFEWLDESSPDNSALVMNHLLKNFNLTTSSSGLYGDREDVGDSPSTVDMSKLWLEIGCNVVDAKLVQSNL
jgi:hypothetical protein